MILSDKSIKEEIEKGNIVIEPYNVECVQPSSIDVHLSGKFLVFNKAQHAVIDVKEQQDNLMQSVEVKDDSFILHPGEFVLGSTMENVKMPNHIAGRIEGKSSLGRLGLLIHSTAGYIDPGFKGNLTLELSNVSPLPIKLFPNMKIGQISFMHMSSEVENPYGSEKLKSKYQGNEGPKQSKFYENFEK
ncbi:dCTP deaminase [Candidatus Woesearchaeota archaeon]|nr:dCTP deaminase [Candidatus Woesearchaeota archaeon]|tara:strand:- start:21218 stop:21781 length:564 start_codon:yes stop_codon:yes gene_type:complete